MKKPTTLTKMNTTPPPVPYSVSALSRLPQTKLTRQEPDSNPNASRGLIYCSPTEPSRRASGRGTSGRGTSGRGTSGRGISGRGISGRRTSARGTSGRGTSGMGTSGRLSPPPDSPSSYCSTSTSEVFLAASASR